MFVKGLYFSETTKNVLELYSSLYRHDISWHFVFIITHMAKFCFVCFVKAYS